jgi:hypothetical protein
VLDWIGWVSGSPKQRERRKGLRSSCRGSAQISRIEEAGRESRGRVLRQVKRELWVTRVRGRTKEAYMWCLAGLRIVVIGHWEPLDALMPGQVD